MRTLLLVRHSVPTLDGSVPASHWHLSQEGQHLCETLARRLAAYEPDVIVTSAEPKAVETGEIVAAILGIPCEVMDGLQEHERPAAGLAPSREAFKAQVTRLLQNPDELVFGTETGEEARDRFSRAIDRVLEKHHAGTVAVVTHGTVMSLFVSHVAGCNPVAFWQSLGLPGFAVLSLPDVGLLQVVGDMTSPPMPCARGGDGESAV